jgi:AcrR family transcriptional regulator
MGSQEYIAKESQSTRALILSAALKEFSEFGFNGTSVRKIGKRADVDFTLITYYFKTKENLWKVVLETGIEKFYKVIEDNFTRKKVVSAIDKLRLRLEGELEFAYSDDSLFKMIMKEYHPNTKRSDWIYKNYFSRNQRELVELISNCQQEGAFSGFDPLMLARVMQTSIRSLLLYKGEFKSSENKELGSEETKDQLWALLDTIYFKNNWK